MAASFSKESSKILMMSPEDSNFSSLLCKPLQRLTAVFITLSSVTTSIFYSNQQQTWWAFCSLQASVARVSPFSWPACHIPPCKHFHSLVIHFCTLLLRKQLISRAYTALSLRDVPESVMTPATCSSISGRAAPTATELMPGAGLQRAPHPPSSPTEHVSRAASTPNITSVYWDISRGAAPSATRAGDRTATLNSLTSLHLRAKEAENPDRTRVTASVPSAQISDSPAVRQRDWADCLLTSTSSLPGEGQAPSASQQRKRRIYEGTEISIFLNYCFFKTQFSKIMTKPQSPSDTGVNHHILSIFSRFDSLKKVIRSGASFKTQYYDALFTSPF